MKETNLTFWTCLFKGTISSTVDFEPGGGIKEEAIYTKYLSSSSKRVVLCDVNFFKSDADELQISPKQTLCFSNEFVSSMVCSRLIYKKKENDSRVSKVRPSSFSSPFFLSDSLSAREKERREGLMRYKSQIFPLTYTSGAFVVFHQLSFSKKNVLTTTKGAKKKSSRFNRRQERVRERARNPLSVSLSWEDATKALLRQRVRARLSVVSLTGEKRGGKVCDTVFFL